MQLQQDIAGTLQDVPLGLLGEVLRPLWQEALQEIRADHQAGADGREIAARIAVAMDAVGLEEGPDGFFLQGNTLPGFQWEGK